VSRRAGLQLVLFLGLVALGILVVEHLPAPDERRGAQGASRAADRTAASEPAVPVAVLEGNELVLRLGGPASVQPALKSSSARPATTPKPASPGPAQQAAKPALPEHDTYVVQPGDSASDIARRSWAARNSPASWRCLNRLSNPGAIRRSGAALR
jgi:hypothetical protein